MGNAKNSRQASYDKRRIKPTERVSWQGFIDIPLSTEDKEALSSVELLPDDFCGIVEWFVEGGYKLSFNADTAHNCVIAAATGMSDACLNQGWTTSGRGPNYIGALNSLYYKVHILAKDGLWSNVGEGREKAAWG